MKKKPFRCEQCREKRVRHDGNLCKACIYNWGLSLEDQLRACREDYRRLRRVLNDCFVVFDDPEANTEGYARKMAERIADVLYGPLERP